ncbi:succinylglutamate desuccinylase/aspartoacylase family protein [Sulfitobacter sp.]|jgi:predicted deacylase|uniref:succinylglutamate desuccinylase/aspartoacylase family protein n=1 Tax=Sulfitobacter sp. TaxID=1903071 RepID=UPI0039E2FDD0
MAKARDDMHRTDVIALPMASPGTQRSLTVHRWGEPGARPKVYIQAGLHADELPGVMTACQLIPLLDSAQQAGQISGEVILLPCANPIGLSQSLHGLHHGRFSFVDGAGNFNRGWPDLGSMVLPLVDGKLGSDPDENIPVMRAALRDAVASLPHLSERQAHQKALLSLSIDADFVFDLHCDAQALLHLFANVEHEDLVMELGCDMGAPVVMLESSIDAGLFDECNGGPWVKVRRAMGLSPDALPAACFAPTIELRGQGDVSPTLAAQDASNIMAFLRRRGMIGGTVPDLAKALCDATPTEGCDMVLAPSAGMVVWHKPIGATVERGDHLADILDLTAHDPLSSGVQVLSPQTGLLFSHRLTYLTRPGDVLGQIAGATPLSHRQVGQFLNP